MPATARGRLSPTREGESPWKNLSAPHLEQGRMLLVEKAMAVPAAFFSLADNSYLADN